MLFFRLQDILPSEWDCDLWTNLQGYEANFLGCWISWWCQSAEQLIRCPFVNSNVQGSDWLWRIILSVWFRNPANQLIYGQFNMKKQGFIHVDGGWESDFLPLTFWNHWFSATKIITRRSWSSSLQSSSCQKPLRSGGSGNFHGVFEKPNKNHPTER